MRRQRRQHRRWIRKRRTWKRPTMDLLGVVEVAGAGEGEGEGEGRGGGGGGDVEARRLQAVMLHYLLFYTGARKAELQIHTRRGLGEERKRWERKERKERGKSQRSAQRSSPPIPPTSLTFQSLLPHLDTVAHGGVAEEGEDVGHGQLDLRPVLEDL